MPSLEVLTGNYSEYLVRAGHPFLILTENKPWDRLEWCVG
jgi:hypothetical protein